MFHGWDNFYLMMGGAGGSLIGLLFVVVTLTQGGDRARVLKAADAYMTPLAVHFAVVLSFSAITMTPGLPAWGTALLFGLAILLGLGNSVRACLTIRSFAKEKEPPHWSDFWWYGAIPLAVYLALGIAAVAIAGRAPQAPYSVAGLLLLLLLTSIRNAWDLITWMAPGRAAPPG